MAKRKTIKEVANKLDDLSKCILESKNLIEITALEQAKTILLDRVFNLNKTTDGSSFGGYSKSYAAKRVRAGKGIKKNLIFEGSLKNSIQQGTYQNKNVVGFTDLDLADIATFQEESDLQINEPIFKLNDTELDAVLETYNTLILEKINECLKKA